MEGVNNFLVHVLEIDGDNVNEIGVIDWRQGALSGQGSRSIEWVDKHPDGQLWINTSGHIWQLLVNTEDWEVFEIAQDFDFDNGGDQWCGIGHDGYNLWLGARTRADYAIVDDNITELYWLMLEPREGEVPSGNNNSMDLTLTLNASGLIEGRYEADIHFLSNDPFNQVVDVGVILDVVPAPDIEVSWGFADEGEPDLVDWNRYHAEIFSDIEYRVPVSVRNIGGATLDISEITSDVGEFSADPNQLSLNQDEEVEIEFVFFDQQAGEFNGVMSFLSNDPDESEFTLRLHILTTPPPQIELDTYEILTELEIGDEENYLVNIANTGLVELRWWSSIEVLNEPDRDRFDRSLRRVDDRSPNRLRDATGDVVTTFSWVRSGSGIHKAGIAWDSDNDWMWLTSFNRDYIGAVDPADDFNEVIAWQPDGQHPMGAAWIEGNIYIVNWAQNWLGIWDSDANNLGSFDSPVHPLSVSATGEYLLVMTDAGNRDISVLTLSGEIMGTINDYQQFIDGE